MGLWRFVISKGVDKVDATAETRAFLEDVQPENLQNPDVWNRLTTLVQVLPDADIFPVRARYAPKVADAHKVSNMPTIGLNYLSADRPLWFTLADCVASKLLTGKAPKIVRAVQFTPKQPQANLRTVAVAGNPAFRVEPTKDDFYKRVIELRRRVKAKLKSEEAADRHSQAAKNLDMEQLALKILANATSYGIFIELNVGETGEEDEAFSIYTSLEKRRVKVKKREQPGRFFHPLLGTLITGAARLMLALTETLARDSGLSWAFCDTDSMAFANQGNLPVEEFQKTVLDICKWFEALNPYERGATGRAVSILDMQRENFDTSGGRTFEPLLCFAISAKRYALFNLDRDGKPIVRKASAHGLGHYVAPYGNEEEVRAERKAGVRLWEEDVWKAIITAALGDTPQIVGYSWRPEMNEPARSRYSATRPTVLSWFDKFNKGRPYSAQVRPFNFMLSFYARRQEDLVAADAGRFWNDKLGEIRPVAPYGNDLAKVLPRIFDRSTKSADHVDPEWLRTVADVLRDYHRQPEHKFLGGGWIEHGILRRRHIFADWIEDIGKESDGWEEDDARSEDQESIVLYPSGLPDREKMIDLIRSVPKRELRRESRVAMRTIDAVHDSAASVNDKYVRRMADATMRIRERGEKLEVRRQHARIWLAQEKEERGLTALAETLRMNAANLSKVIGGRRNPSEKILVGIETLIKSSERTPTIQK